MIVSRDWCDQDKVGVSVYERKGGNDAHQIELTDLGNNWVGGLVDLRWVCNHCPRKETCASARWRVFSPEEPVYSVLEGISASTGGQQEDPRSGKA